MPDPIALGDYVEDTVSGEIGYIRHMSPDGEIILDCWGDAEEPYFWVVPPNHEVVLRKDPYEDV